MPVLERLITDFPACDAQILVENEDPLLHPHGTHDDKAGTTDSTKEDALGPNPKIRNISRAYREAKSDIVWIIDCNVWVGPGVAGRMVDSLCGFGGGRPNKFVHQLPLVVDTEGVATGVEAEALFSQYSQTSKGQEASTSNGDSPRLRLSTTNASYSQPSTRPGSPRVDRVSPGSSLTHALSHALTTGGGRLEEMFLSTAHAKFYTAINSVLIAPCIVGKSNMFRRSHLDTLTNGQGIAFFSRNICEDHLIGDLLWRARVLEEQQPNGEKWGKHALAFGDPAVQPVARMAVGEYCARRVRWLRVRKFTVTLATLVEPGTESVLCSLYGAFAITSLPWFREVLGVPATWSAFWTFFALSVGIWACVDWTLYGMLQRMACVEQDGDTPFFAKPPPESGRRRGFGEWFLAWLGREGLAFWIWAWAVYGGVTVVWRGRKFWVGVDMKVHEVGEEGGGPVDKAIAVASAAFAWSVRRQRKD